MQEAYLQTLPQMTRLYFHIQRINNLVNKMAIHTHRKAHQQRDLGGLLALRNQSCPYSQGANNTSFEPFQQLDRNHHKMTHTMNLVGPTTRQCLTEMNSRIFLYLKHQFLWDIDVYCASSQLLLRSTPTKFINKEPPWRMMGFSTVCNTRYTRIGSSFQQWPLHQNTVVF